MKAKTEQTQCVVCGARCRVITSNTCDSTCTRAQQAHRSRTKQIRFEIQLADRDSRLEAEMDNQRERSNRRNLEDLHYNQPYLAVA